MQWKRNKLCKHNKASLEIKKKKICSVVCQFSFWELKLINRLYMLQKCCINIAYFNQFYESYWKLVMSRLYLLEGTWSLVI